MKLTEDLIHDSVARPISINDQELILRDLNITAIENLEATKDLNNTIDFTNNDLRILGNFPRLTRLKHLLLANNRISKIDSRIASFIPQLTTIVLTNNAIQELGDIEPLTYLNSLQHLVLLDNPVTKKEHYRSYVIYKLPSLRVLDYDKIEQQEHDEAQRLFQSNDRQDNELAQSITDNKSKSFESGEGVPEA